MTEIAKKWEPVADIDIAFGSIWYSYSGDSLTATLRGSRSLSLRFSGVVALRFELECPGFDELPRPLPVLRPGATFPLLVVESSCWLEQYEPIYLGRKHFALVSSDDLVQLIANPQVNARWE